MIYYRLRPQTKNPKNATIQCIIKKGTKTLASFSTYIAIPLNIWVKELNAITYTETHKTEYYAFEVHKKNTSEIVQNLHDQKQDFTTEELKEILFKEETKYIFSDLKEKVLLHYTALIAKGEVKKSVLVHSKQYIKKFESFLNSESLTKKNLCNFSKKDAENFCDYLRKNTFLQPNTRRKTVQSIKAYFEYACKWELIQKNPFEFVEMPKTAKKTLIFLTDQERERLERYSFESNSLERVKDLFLLQCYTGLAYIDLYNLITQKTELVRLEEQPNDKQGFDFWITGNRQKSSSFFSVPLLPKALSIIQKHNGIQNVPIISNQNYNKFLKEVAKVCAIDKNITTHTARKTFGFYALNEGVSIESVAKMLGHSNIAITQKLYAQVLNKRIGQEMEKIKDLQTSNIILKITNEDKELLKNYSQK